MKEEPEVQVDPEEQELMESTAPQDALPTGAKVLNALIIMAALILVSGFAVAIMNPRPNRGAIRSHRLEMERRQETLEQAKREADGHDTTSVDHTVAP